MGWKTPMVALVTVVILSATAMVTAFVGQTSAAGIDSFAGVFDPDTVVAQLDQKQLTLGELMVRFATLSPLVRARYGDNLDKFLADTVANMAVAERAESLDLDQDPLFELLLSIRREELLRDLYARRTVLAEIDQATLEQRYGNQLSLRFQRRERLRLRQILMTPVAEARPFNSRQEDAVGIDMARQKAASLRQLVAGGQASFEQVARELSEDASAPQGGDLGWLSPQELMPSLHKAAANLPLGEVSEVIESPLGFHILEVLDRRPAGDVPLELVRELLFQEIVGEQSAHYARSAAEDRQRLVSEASIELFPERLPW